MNVTRETIRLFWHHASRYPTALLPVIILLPVVTLIADFLLPFIIAEVLQRVSQGDYNPNDLWGSFGQQITLFIIGTIASAVIGWRIIVWVYWHLELMVVRDIAQRVFNHLILMSANFHANRFGGSLVSQANKLLSAYIRFMDATYFNLYGLLVAVTATVVLLAPRAPLYAIVLVMLIVLFVIGMIVLSKKVRLANTLEAQAQSQQTGYLADSISNVMAMKSFSAAPYEEQRYWQAVTHTRDMGRQTIRATIQRETVASLLTSGIRVSALVIAVIGVGLFKTDVATIFLMVSFTAAIGHRLWDFQNVLRNYNRAFGDASDMVKILHITPEVKDPVAPQALRIKQGAIEFKNVYFTHADSHKDDSLFRGLNLTIRPGEKIGLVGHSGSGKTTLTKLLLRFADIDAGEILIDGQNIAHITQDDLRQSISYVPQEPLLFHRTIKENIAYGQPEASDEEIAEAARKAQATEFIEKLPHKYGTLVGERGVKLSGGQRQRIAIARAILKDAPILVLDEATSALDSESERLIQAALGELMKNRTAIVIAHRLSTVQKMDRIIVLDNGEIIEQGSHKELLGQKGEYAKLWAHQSGGFIDE